MADNNQKKYLDIKKTLLISIDFPPNKGGVANYLANFCSALNPQKLTVLAQKQTDDQVFDQKQNYTIKRKQLYFKIFWPKWLKTYFLAKKIIKRENIEQIIISHIIPVGYLCLLLKVPYVVILHGYDVLLTQESGWKSFWAQKILNKAKHIIVNSSFTKEKVLQYQILENKISVIYPCPNIKNEINQAEKQSIINELDLENKKILLSVGRLVKRKGVDNVIKSLPAVLKKIPNLAYLVIGNGDYKDTLKKLAEELNVMGNITFLEDISDNNLPIFYDLADIFIQPARIEQGTDVEGFGIVYLEANLFGKPVIAGNVGGAKEAVKNNYSGILVDPNNEQEIESAILKLLSDKTLMNKLGEQGKNRVSVEFNIQKQLEKIKNII